MYVADATLSQGTDFKWMIDDEGSVEIRRRFANGQEVINSYASTELDRLHFSVSEHDWVALANNVEKLNHGTEQQGIGKFIKEELGKSVLDAQGASQLAAIFVKSGAWQDNGLKRGIAFRRLREDWQSRLRSYFEQKR
ncbi:MAG: hypothetical protein ACOX2K_10475 [Bacillota bacterium]|jgi:hypothetical protein